MGIELHTLFTGATTNKLYKASGMFTSTIKTSLGVLSVMGVYGPTGISYDSALSGGVTWVGNDGYGAYKIYKTSGVFSSTVKSSLNYSALGSRYPVDTCAKETDTLISTIFGSSPIWQHKFFIMSGRMTSTIKNSMLYNGSQTMGARGITTDGTDSMIHGGRAAGSANYFTKYSGIFTSTVKTSLYNSAFQGAANYLSGMEEYNGDLLCGGTTTSDKVWKMSGIFTTTVKSSQSYGSSTIAVRGISYLSEVSDTPASLPRFPTDISYGSSGGPTYNTEIVSFRDGGEQRNIAWKHGRCQFDASFGVRVQSQLNTLIAFFRAMEGKTGHFRYKDWSDYSATGENLGSGDGADTTFQLRKAYTIGGYTYYRSIYKPVSGTVIIYKDGITQTNGVHYTVNYITGVITFVTAPAEGEVITADFEFDVLSRFDTDKLSKKFSEYGVYSVTTVPIIEERYSA